MFQINIIVITVFIGLFGCCTFFSTQEPPQQEGPARKIVLKEVPAGTFFMGADDAYSSASQHPVHMVALSNFSMQETEVTQEQYESIMGVNPSHFVHYLGKTDMPVEQVTWYDAVLFCNALSKKDSLDTVYRYSSITGTPGNGCTLLDSMVIDYAKKGYRLPTEAEWEYACRAGSTTLYWWGDDESGAEIAAWCYGNSHYATQPVATKTRNPFGLFDMTGNVWEWCNDWSGTYDSIPKNDPIGPDNTTNAIKRIRSGSWYDDCSHCRSSYRRGNPPGNAAYFIGFRVVLPK